MDDLNHKVDELGRRMDEGFRDMRAETNARFEKVDTSLETMQRTMVQGFVALTAAIVAGFGGMAGLIATLL